MSSCCTPPTVDSSQPRKHRCPVNGRDYIEVPTRTIAHHIVAPWNWQPAAIRYFYCDDPACDIAYFGDDGSIIAKAQLRHPIGVKEYEEGGLLCYCFGISKAEFRRNPALKDYVIAQTKAGLCSCETSNPSGRCCLKNFS